MLDEGIIQILLGLLFTGVASWSFHRHYITKDGIGRIMMLWMTGFLTAMLAFRALGYYLVCIGVLNIVTHRTYNQYVIMFVYAAVMCQFLIQTMYNRKRLK